MTVIEYFQKAKEDGYEWAENAIRNMEQHSWMFTDIEVKNLADALYGGFVWKETPEGLEYWDAIWDGLRQKRKTKKKNNRVKEETKKINLLNMIDSPLWLK